MSTKILKSPVIVWSLLAAFCFIVAGVDSWKNGETAASVLFFFSAIIQLLNSGIHCFAEN